MIDAAKALKQIGEPVSFNENVTPPLIGGVTIAEVCIEGDVTGLDMDTLCVSGTIRAKAKQECARCAKTAEFVLESEFEELFTRAAVETRTDNFRFEGSQIDPEALVTSLFVLAMPMRVLCDEECKGLCPICGQDLNEGECGHEYQNEEV